MEFQRTFLDRGSAGPGDGAVEPERPSAGFSNSEVVFILPGAAEGADELVFYDITASPEGRTLDYGWVKSIARLLDIPFCVAGGIRSVDQAAACLDHGADKVSINSAAVATPINWLTRPNSWPSCQATP